MKFSYRVIAMILITMILVQSFGFSNAEAAAKYKNLTIEKALSASDAEYLFGDYSNFKVKYLEDVKELDVFLFFFSNPKEMLKSLRAGWVPDEIAKKFMNDVESVKPLLRDAIGEMSNNKDLKVLSSDNKYLVELFKDYYKNAGYNDIEDAISDMLKVFKTIENVDKILKDYTENMMMLETLKEIFPKNSEGRKMIDALQKDYSNKLFSTVKEYIAKKVEKIVIKKTIDPLDIYSSIQKALENKKSIKALEYVIYSSSLQSEATIAYRKAVVKIKSGDYTDVDVMKYINSFELSRVFTLKLYEKMRGNYKSKDSEYKYLTEQISNLKNMTYDKPIKGQTYSQWIKGGSGSHGGGSGGGGFRGDDKSDTGLAIPRGLEVVKTGNSTSQILWNSVSGALSYEVQYRSPKTNDIWVKDMDYKSNTSTSYDSAGMIDGRTYSFRVRAVSNTSISDWSPEITYTHWGTSSPNITQPALNVRNTLKGNYTVTISANTTVYGFSGSTSTTRLTLYTPKIDAFNLYCTERLDMSDGTTRYFFRSGGNTAKDYYLMFTNSMNVTDYSTVQRKVAIQYNANGGSGAPEKQEFTVGSRAVLSSTIPVQNGYVFAGWSLTGTSGSTLYPPGSGYNIDKDTTFYAMWTNTANYTLTYDADGGTGAPPSQTTKAMETWILSSVIPTRTGYDFVGWADIAGAYRAIWNPNQSLMAKSDKTIYAVWRKIPEPSIDPPTLDVYQLNEGWINMVTKSIGGTKSEKIYQCDVYFGVQYKIKCSKAIDSYCIEIFDSQKNLLSTITKEPQSAAETWISEKTNIYKLSYIDNEGTVENVTHTPLDTPLKRDNTYYWRVYFICDGQRTETDIQSFVFTISEGFY